MIPPAKTASGWLLLIAAGRGQAQPATDNQAVMSLMLSAVARCLAVSASTALQLNKLA